MVAEDPIVVDSEEVVDNNLRERKSGQVARKKGVNSPILP